MSAESKSLPEVLPFSPAPAKPAHEVRRWVLWLQVGTVYSAILIACWTPEGPLKAGLMLATTFAIAILALCGRFTAKEMGLGTPPLQGSLLILALGVMFALTLPLIASLAGLRFPPIRMVPWRAAGQYAVWALMQQFALQSFFYLRVESLVGSRRAVVLTALLFATIHLPSPVLTVATAAGGLFFCEMFRRYRTIISLGLVHAMLGLTIAASFSDHLLHHMRVGIGFLAFHP